MKNIEQKNLFRYFLLIVFFVCAGLPVTVNSAALKVISLSSSNSETIPKQFELFLDQVIIFESDTPIRMFLATKEDILSIDKSSPQQLRITSSQIGQTFLHLWDGNGRWTFYFQVMPEQLDKKIKSVLEQAKGFVFNYRTRWGSYYKGPSFGLMTKRSMTMTQSLKMQGPTPYGDFDASLDWSKFGHEDKILGYTLGLTKGKFGPFEDFSLRGFDFSTRFSALSFPGGTLYGISFFSPIFNKAFSYEVFHGREKGYYSQFLRPGINSDTRDAFVEGIRIGVTPQEKNKVFFNFAQGYGRDRPDYLRRRVFSIENETGPDNLRMRSEVAFDEDSMAARFTSHLNIADTKWIVDLRNVETDFVNIVGRPSGRGEIGGRVSCAWSPTENLSLDSSLNVYRDRYLFNLGNRRGVNYEAEHNLRISLDKMSNVSVRASYVNMPQVSSPQRRINGNVIYNRRFETDFLGKRVISTHIGYIVNQSKFPLSERSNYRRHGIITGLKFPLVQDLFYYANFARYYAQGLTTKEQAKPSVLETGIDFYRRFNKFFSSDINFYYRDEERADSTHAFLAGEDSIEGRVNFNYTPGKGVRFYCDGRVRNVWAENAGVEKFIEANISVGANITWESFLCWTPTAEITGCVFEDVNANTLREDGEPGVKNVEIHIGPYTVVTDEQGTYRYTLRAKSVMMDVDPNTIPKGYLFTTSSAQRLKIDRGGKQEINFGVAFKSRVYGIVFYDQNKNGKVDSSDPRIAGVKVLLNGEQLAFSNSMGLYHFRNVLPGKYTFEIDMSTLPLEYLPLIRVKQEIEVPMEATYTLDIPLDKK